MAKLCIECEFRPQRFAGRGLCNTCYMRDYKRKKALDHAAKRPTNGNVCKCGCGQLCYRKNDKWITGHQKTYLASIKTCLCGCGTPVNATARYVLSHRPHVKVTGYRHTAETRRKMSLARKGRSLRPAWRHAISQALRRGGGALKQRHETIRKWAVYKEWRTAVFERDNYTCQECGARSGNGKQVSLQAHHIIPFSVRADLILSVSNGRTLCVTCHRKTDSYGEKAKKKYNRRQHKTALQLPMELVIY